MTYIKEKLKGFGMIDIAVIAALLFCGGYNEYISYALGALCSVFLIIKARGRKLRIRLNFTVVSVFTVALFYLITVFYAVDPGSALIGFMKFLPVPLFLLLIEGEDRDSVILRLPYYALLSGAVSLALMYVPAFEPWFSVAGRLAGTFQYPNTFALFLLVGEAVLLSKDKMRADDVAVSAALFALILFTGSRTVFVIAVAVNLILFFLKRGKRIKITICAAVAVLVVSAVVFYPFLKDSSLFGRFFALSFSESTFAGRLLYWMDALPQILSHPFGLGYLGYYYIEPSIQTGVYAVKYIHNDLLQMMLDVGWIPAVAFYAAMVKGIFAKGVDRGTRVIITAVLLHSLFDFDFEFTAMVFILLLFVRDESGREFNISSFVSVGYIAAGIASLYFSAALGLAHFGAIEAAHSMYPWDTQNNIARLTEASDSRTCDAIADDILSRNSYVTVAYSAKAISAVENGDFVSFMDYKHKAFESAPFSSDEYRDYCYTLVSAIHVFEQNDDKQSADVCREELAKTAEALTSLNDRLSPLGRIIVDQPDTELPKDLSDYINKHKIKE